MSDDGLKGRVDVLDRTVRVVSRALSIGAGLVLLAVLTLVAADVFLRIVQGRGISGTVEYVQVLLVTMIYLSFAYAERDGSHVSVGLVVDRLPHSVGKYLEVAGLLVSLVFLAIAAKVGVSQALQSYRTGEYAIGVERVAVWPARLALAVGFVWLCSEIVARILLLLADRPVESEERA